MANVDTAKSSLAFFFAYILTRFSFFFFIIIPALVSCPPTAAVEADEFCGQHLPSCCTCLPLLSLSCFSDRPWISVLVRQGSSPLLHAGFALTASHDVPFRSQHSRNILRLPVASRKVSCNFMIFSVHLRVWDYHFKQGANRIL